MAKARRYGMAREAALVAHLASRADVAPIDPRKNQNRRKTPQRARNQNMGAHRRKAGFSPERQSGYTVTRNGGTTTASRVHGLVVNELAGKLTGMGFTVSNTGLGGDIRPDLVITEVPAVVEVKTKGEWDDVIHGVGQCFVFSAMQDDPDQMRKLMVMPATIDSKKLEVLARLGIAVVKWRLKGENVVFTGLKRALRAKVTSGL